MTSGQKVFMWILIVLVIGLVGFIFYPYGKNYYQKHFVKTQTTPTTDTSSLAIPLENEIVVPVSDAGVTWLATPEKLADLGLFKSASNSVESITSAIYYKVANLDNNGSIILASAEINSMGSPVIIRFKKDKDGKYQYLLKHSYQTDTNEASKILKDGVTIDYTTIYQSLSAPAFLTVNGVTLKSTLSEYSRKMYKDLTSPTEVANSEYGKIYQTFGTATNGLNGSTLNLRLPDYSIVSYTNKFAFMPDDDIALITWKDSTKNTAKYTPEGYVGCARGGTDNIIANTTNIATRLLNAGQTNTGDKINTVAATDDVMKAAYENYKIGRTKDVLTIEAFAAKNPIFIWKDGFGDYVVFTGRDYAGLAECGKPVIYLYPTKTTQVSVKVGADITKSDPAYNNGWTAVAKPNGKLTVAGVVYPYLFWEGIGQEYPNIEGGKVVAKADTEQTIKADLADLGLNNQESADFLEFWLSKMPTTPYVRLTWFGTNQMNKLAPLAVEPKPDTMIRVFLDFEGLNELINIPAQKLSHIERHGFTLIEWGGLLIGGK